MKTTVLIAIFISCCFAQTCMVNSVQCADIGDSCSNGCPGCFDAFQTCLLSATNATEQCACGEEFVNCYADAKDGTCSSYSAYAQCIALDPTCPCGTPYTGPTVTTNCDNNAYCSSAGKCVAVKAVGAACNMSNECGDSSGSLYGNSYSCVNNKCQMDASAMPGDACSKDSDCAYFVPASLGCVSGKCASQAAGKACVNTTDSLDCGPGLYCDSTNTCKNTIAMGAACDHSSDDECGVTGTCSSTDVCIKMFSKTAGQACKYDQECANGLYCSESSGTCATVLASDVSCMNVTQCTDISDDYIACSCNAMGDFHCQAPSGPSAQCKDLLAAFGQCVSDNGCSEDSHIAGGCIATNCASQISCYFKCLAENGETLTNAFGCVANYEDSCGAGTTGSTTSMGVKEVASAGLVALAVAALL